MVSRSRSGVAVAAALVTGPDDMEFAYSRLGGSYIDQPFRPFFQLRFSSCCASSSLCPFSFFQSVLELRPLQDGRWLAVGKRVGMFPIFSTNQNVVKKCSVISFFFWDYRTVFQAL